MIKKTLYNKLVNHTHDQRPHIFVDSTEVEVVPCDMSVNENFNEIKIIIVFFIKSKALHVAL